MVENIVFLSNPKWLASSIMIACYLVLFSEKVNRAVIALLSAMIMIVLGIFSQAEAFRAIDFNTISLLIGMMVIVSITERSGLFQFVAVWGAKLVRANPAGLMVVLGLVTALFSAFLDNVTTVLLIVPVTFQMTRKLQITPYPYLLIEIFASNIGGTATLIGDPPNILIGSALELSFMDFVVHLAPAVVIALFVLILGFVLIWRPNLQATDKNRAAMMRIQAKSCIVDKTLLHQSLFVLSLVICGFVLAEKFNLSNGSIALCGAAVLLVLYTLKDKHHTRDEKTEEMFNLVDWTTVFFFCGLFMVVFGLEKTGVLDILGQHFVALTNASVKRATFLVLFSSAFISSAIDNIPFVATMIPTLKAMEESFGGREAMMPVWWALSLGSCFGGNGSLIGASANVIVAGLASREGHPLKFLGFLLWSVPVMLISILISAVYLYLKFFC